MNRAFIGAWIACLGCQEKAESPPLLSVSPDALDFGDVAVDDDAALSLTLTNEGGGEIELLSLSLIEGDSSAWSVARDGEDILGAGESQTAQISFSPVEEGEASGRLQLRSTDEVSPSFYVDLLGVGTPSMLDLDGDGYSPSEGDCDDENPDAWPGADEVCDGADNDCDGSVPGDEADDDYDGWRLCDGDCDDTDENIYPGAPEICDGEDSDCDGVSADESDLDGDGFTICDGDCDDDAATAYPGGIEVCDGLDNDCTGEPDDIDADGDGHTPCDPTPDCDDDDFDARPVVVSVKGSDESGDGTTAAPYLTLDHALTALDRVCREVYLLPGEYEVSTAWSDGALSVLGAGEDPSEVVLRPPKGARIFEVRDGAALTVGGLTLTGAAAKGDGGAIQAVSAALTLSRVQIEANTCTGDGGAIAVASGSLSVRRSTFVGNEAADDGGAIAVVSSTFDDEGSVYRDNVAVRGGAILAEATALDLVDLSVRDNAADEEGGGLAALGGSQLSIEGGAFLGNTAGARGGGLVLVDINAAGGGLRNLFIQDNSAGDQGGGVAIYGSTAAFSFTNNTLFGNAAEGDGAGIWIDASDASGLTVWSNLVTWSTGESGLFAATGAGADVAWNLGYATSSTREFAGAVQEGVDENLNDNPLYVEYSADGDPDNDVLDLEAGSPAVDSGPSDSEWNDPDGSRNDRGATGGPGATP